ncbi:hypothetical protein AB0J73_52675, partial [Nonomuraea fuscirosea]
MASPKRRCASWSGPSDGSGRGPGAGFGGVRPAWGFLVEQDADRSRFAHALVREALYEDIAHARRARWQATAAGIVERLRPGDVETIAHHCLRAQGRAGAARTASGELQGSWRWRVEAVGAAEAIGDPVLTAKVIGSFDVPAIWTANDDPALSVRLVAAAERTLAALPSGHEGERARLLVTIAMERRADLGQRGERAAREAEEIARRPDDRTLLAYTLNGRYQGVGSAPPFSAGVEPTLPRSGAGGDESPS